MVHVNQTVSMIVFERVYRGYTTSTAAYSFAFMPVFAAEVVLLKISHKPAHLLLYPLLDNLPPLWIAPPCHEMQAAPAAHSTWQSKPSPCRIKGGYSHSAFLALKYANDVKLFIFVHAHTLASFTLQHTCEHMRACVCVCNCSACKCACKFSPSICLILCMDEVFPCMCFYSRMSVCVWPAVWRYILLAPGGGGLENRAGEFQIPILPLNMSRTKLQTQQNSRGSLFFCFTLSICFLYKQKLV